MSSKRGMYVVSLPLSPSLIDDSSSLSPRWNKLNLRSYISRSFSTDEEIPIRLAHQKPFYFSRVKSYPAY